MKGGGRRPSLPEGGKLPSLDSTRRPSLCTRVAEPEFILRVGIVREGFPHMLYVFNQVIPQDS